MRIDPFRRPAAAPSPWLPLLCVLLSLTAPLPAQEGGPQPAARVGEAVVAMACTGRPARVVFDRPGDGRLWARGANYKASFGDDGFTYVPYFGSGAPRNFPLRFVLHAVRVGGQPLELPAAPPRQAGDTVTFARGAVHEIYELRPDAIEQRFVVDSDRGGDVAIELQVVGELDEDAAAPGLQFGNAFGRVEYGEAHVVASGGLHAVQTTYTDGAIRIHVPAALRGPGPLVVDPILSTTVASLGPNDTRNPDVAYDADQDVFLVVWEELFSATDTDINSQLVSRAGQPIPGTELWIDVTTVRNQRPRVANSNVYDRFLCVFERFTGNTLEVWGRMRLANVPTQMSSMLQVNDQAAYPGPAGRPDVGGDPGPGLDFLVAWTYVLGTHTDIHARLLRGDGLPTSPTLVLDDAPNSTEVDPEVSCSNGNGSVASPRWAVAWSRLQSTSGRRVLVRMVGPGGALLTPRVEVDTSFGTDEYPSVSSPLLDAAGAPLFLLSWVRTSLNQPRARVFDGSMQPVTPVVDLSPFGIGLPQVRVDSDGTRFAVLSGDGSNSATVATLALQGATLVAHEAPQVVSSARTELQLASARSGGGGRTDYLAVGCDPNWFPDRTVVSLYQGRSPGADVTRRVMGCSGLGIDWSGRAFVGEVVTFALSNVGADIPGFVFGLPVPASNLQCAPCPLGVDLASAIVVISGSLPFAIPASPGFVGYQGAVQGFALGSGPCIVSLRFADTLDFTVR